MARTSTSPTARSIVMSAISGRSWRSWDVTASSRPCTPWGSGSAAARLAHDIRARSKPWRAQAIGQAEMAAVAGDDRVRGTDHGYRFAAGRLVLLSPV